MKKTFLILGALVLVACSTKTEMPDAKLTLPTLTQAGYIKLDKNAEYYVDSSSIWLDSTDKSLVHFDTINNFENGLFVYSKQPKLYARSSRQSKILNCDTYNLIHIKTDYYSEFWGKGIRAEKSIYDKEVHTLQKGSSLHTIGQVICANMKRSW